MAMVTTTRRKMTPARKRRIRDAHEGVCGVIEWEWPDAKR